MAEKSIDELLDGHLEKAGIDVSTQDGVVQNEPQVDASETADTTDTATTTPTTEPKADPEPKPAGEDSVSSGVDGAAKPGKEKEGQDTLSPGDLKLQDGTIVKAGAERRHYEQLQIVRQQLGTKDRDLGTLRTERDQLKQKLDAFETATQQLQGVNPTEAATAVGLYKDLINNPVQTIEKLIAEAKALGHTIGVSSPGIDTNAIAALIDQRLGASARTDTQPTQQDIENAAVAETQEFLRQYPDANLQQDAMAYLVQRNPTATLEELYFGLKSEAAKQGFDWSQPLGPQIAARKTPTPTPKPAPTPQPIVNGRVRDDFESNDLLNNKPPVQGDSTDDIIRAAMAEARQTQQR